MSVGEHVPHRRFRLVGRSQGYRYPCRRSRKDKASSISSLGRPDSGKTNGTKVPEHGGGAPLTKGLRNECLSK